MTSQNPRDMRDYMRTLERISAGQRAMPELVKKIVDEVKEEEKEVKARRPAAPIELASQSAFYTDAVLKRQRVLFLLDFPDVIFNTDGTKADIQQYELWGRPVTAAGVDEEPWELRATSVESAFRDDRYETNSQWVFRARALGMDAVQPGEWSEEITVRMVKDTVPPPQPSAPVVTVTRGVLTVTWNGKAVTGDMPLDFDYAILAHDIVTSPTREVGRFTQEGGFKVIADLKYRVMQFFRVRAVDQSGNLGPWSAVASGFTTPLVDEDVILSEIDAAKTVIKNADKVILESGVQLGKKLQDADTALAETEAKLTGPGGLTERLAGVDNKLKDVGALTYATGQTLRQKLALSDTAISTAQGQLTTLRNTTLPKLDSDLLAAGVRLDAADVLLKDTFPKQLTAIENQAAAQQALIQQAIASGQSLVINGDFEAGMTGWQQIAAVEVIAEAARSGKAGMRITPAGSNAWPSNQTVATSTGRTYYMEMWVRRIGADTASTLSIGFVAQSRHAVTNTYSTLIARPPGLTTGDIPTDRFVKVSAEVTVTQEDANRVTFAPWFYQSATNSYDIDDMLVVDVTEAKKLEAGLSAAEASIKKVADQVSPLEKGLDLLNKTTIPGLQTSINGKTSIIKSTGNAPANVAAPYGEGDIFERWSSLSTGGKLLKSWRARGTVWVEEIMDATYLPLVDIGAGTFGTLAGGRLEVNSVTADKVLIGVGGNLYPDPDMLDVAGYAAGTGIGLFGIGSGKTGRGSLLIGASDVQTGSYYGWSLANRRTPIVAGGQYLVSAWARGNGVPVGGAGLYVRFYKADNTYVWGTPSAVTNSEPYVNNNWAEIKGTFTAPADTVSLVMGFYSQASNTAAVRFSDPSVRQASGGELIVNGSITGTHIDAESVGAKVGNFVKINVENITATATATLNSVVAQRIAAGTASFQTVDAKNLFVTGTSSLDTVVAKRFAADTGKFLELGVEQLTVTASANLNEAVANKFFANIFASNKLTTNELMVGKGENLIPWAVNNPVPFRTVDPHVAMNGASALSLDGAGGMIAGHALTNNQNVTPGTFATTIQLRPGVKYPNLAAGVFQVLPLTKYKASVWVRAGGAYGTYPKIRLNVGLYDEAGVYHAGPLVTPGVVISWSWQEIVLEFETRATTSGAAVYIQMDQPGTLRIDTPSLTKDAASLIATGGIVADHITASEAMSAKIGSFLTLDVGKLTATGTSTLATAVIENLWTKVVRSRSITTDMLLVGKGANLIPNGDLANGKEGWSPDFGLNVGDASALKEGFPASLWLAGRQTKTSTEMFSVKAGVKYKFSMWARGNVTGKRFYVQLVTNDEAANIYLVQNQLTYVALTQYTAEFEVPSSATSARLSVYANHQNGTTSDGHQWFTGFELHEMNAASLIVTGGIVTEHLKITSSMTAALLKAKKVEAIEIDANSLTADTAWIGVLRGGILINDVVDTKHIMADAIDAKHRITGALVRTAATGARTEMTNQGIRVLNASNIELVRLGYGIATGISVRNPSSGILVPLSNMVFGTQLIIGYVDANQVDNKITPVKGALTFNVVDKASTPPSTTRVWMTAQTETHAINFQIQMAAWTNSSFVDTSQMSGRAGMCLVNVQIYPESGTMSSNFLGSLSGPVGYHLSNESYLSGMFTATGLVPGRRYRFGVMITNLDNTAPMNSSTFSPEKITILSLPM